MEQFRQTQQKRSRPGPSPQSTSKRPRSTTILRVIEEQEQPELLEFAEQLQETSTSIRRQYSREFKLAAITYYHQHKETHSLYRISQDLKLPDNGKTLKQWIQDEQSIIQLKVSQRKATKG